MVKLLADSSFDLKIGDAWFNGHKHLPDVVRPRGVAEAERLTAVLTGSAGNRRRIPWNAAFDAGSIVRPDDLPDGSGVAGPLPVIEFPWGLRLTILSPTRQALANLRKDWQKYRKHRVKSRCQSAMPVVEVGANALAADKDGS